jgi:hypothetical protein
MSRLQRPATAAAVLKVGKAGKPDRPVFSPTAHADPAAYGKFPEYLPEPLPPNAAERLKAAGMLGRTAKSVAAEKVRPDFAPASPGRNDRLIRSVVMHPLNISQYASGHTRPMTAPLVAR